MGCPEFEPRPLYKLAGTIENFFIKTKLKKHYNEQKHILHILNFFFLTNLKIIYKEDEYT